MDDKGGFDSVMVYLSLSAGPLRTFHSARTCTHCIRPLRCDILRRRPGPVTYGGVFALINLGSEPLRQFARVSLERPLPSANRAVKRLPLLKVCVKRRLDYGWSLGALIRAAISLILLPPLRCNWLNHLAEA